MATMTASRVAPSRSAASPLTLLTRMYGAWRQRRHLAQLDDRARRDIGLTEGEALRESLRPIWVIIA